MTSTGGKLTAFVYCPTKKNIVKSPFGLSSDTLFQLSVIYKQCRQVLTPVNNSQLLLKLEILDHL